MRIVIVILFLFIWFGGRSQSSLNVCKINLDARPYFISPELDTVSAEQLLKTPVLQTGKTGLTVMSFQMGTATGSAKWFVINKSLLSSYWAVSFLKKATPGTEILLECIQAKDTNGITYVLQNRKYIIR